MGNSAGVSNNQGQTTDTEPSENKGDNSQIEWDEIPVDNSESPAGSRMSDRSDEGSHTGSSPHSGKSQWSRHDRYFKKHYWYSHRRLCPRASERDRELGGFPDSSASVNGIPHEKVMPKLDNRRLNAGLYVTDVDLHIEDNTQAHHTNMYQCTGSRRCHPSRKKAELVIRRGEEFQLTLNFNKRCDIRKSDLTLVFNLGDDVKPGCISNCIVKVDTRGDKSYIPRSWGATCTSQDEKSITLSVHVPPTAPVGEWEFSVTSIAAVCDGKDVVWQYNHNEEINIIFNPWCRDDPVYMQDERWRREAVLNDSGSYYHGSSDRMAASPWFYGQFEDGILEAAFHMLRKGCGYKTTPSMANPAVVTRVLSNMINCDDENGVMTWAWSGNYDDGTAPTKWKGSDKILRQYMETGKPVRYGQCWVFAGLLTTVCRALGIPSRAVTNYSSGHNTDNSQLSIDFFTVKDANGRWMEVSDDSIWVFHVWSEVWMRRADLDETGKYNGWQAVDPTPLHRSDGVYSVGPCPVAAIKEGELNVDRDAAAMFSQVNADKVIWREDDKTGRLIETRRLRSLVGKMISTHEPTGRPYRGASIKTYRGKQKLERLDLTSEYKYQEGSDEEQNAVWRAEKAFHLLNACLRPRKYHHDNEDNDVDPEDSIQLEIGEIGDVFVGSDFEFEVLVHNTGSKTRSIRKAELKVFYKTYYGVNTGLAESGTFRGFELEPGQREKIKIDVSSKVARARPEDGFHLELQAVVELRDRDYILTETQPFLLRRPNIRLKGPTHCGQKEEIEVEVVFDNPLSVALTNCEIDIEGGLACLDPTEDNYTIPNIAPSGTWKTVLFLRPKLHPVGKKVRDLSLALESAELKDVIGYYAVKVD